MTENKYASFKIRLVAALLDFATMIILWAFSSLYIVNQPGLPKAVSAAFVVLLIFLNPIMMFSSILFTYYFGGTPGKLMTGLRIVDEHNKPLSFKRIVFRQTVGYSFSWLFFGLGYFSLIKDPKGQAWHDKAIGSYVTAKHNLFIIGLALFFIIMTAAGSLFSTAFSTFSKGPLGKEADALKAKVAAEEKAAEETKRHEEELKQLKRLQFEPRQNQERFEEI